ncbi:MAG: Gldg family protein [Phycisphaerae bacterium]
MAVNAKLTAAPAGQRRIAYGANVLLSSLLAFALLVVVVILSGRFDAQADLTSGGANSLSPATRQMLASLDQDVTITGLYAVLSEYQKFAQKRKDTVRDLLTLYEQAGRGRVTARMVDPMKEVTVVQGLLARLKQKPAYVDEAKPHEAAIAKLPEIIRLVDALSTSETQELGKLAETNERLKQVREFLIVYSNLQRVGRDAKNLEADVAELKAGDVPRYGRAVEAMRESLTRVRTMLADCLDWISKDAAQLPGLTPDAQSFFASAGERYTQALEPINALLADTENLQRVKLEEVYETLARSTQEPPILIETKDEARVVTMGDVWPARSPQAPEGPDGDPLDFNGEQAVSAAVLALTQKERTAVVFVRFGGEPLLRPDFSRMNPMMMMNLPRAPFQQMGDLLEKQNFITQEWDLATTKQPPTIADAKHIVYVVLPPEPPPQPNPMQPAPTPGITPTDKQLLYGSIEQSGLAIFLTGWGQPRSRMFPTPEPYEYAEYLRTTWGIDVKRDYLTLRFTSLPDKPGLWGWGNSSHILTSPDLVEFTDHKITGVLQTQPAGFTLVAPLAIVTGEGKPADVTVEELVRVRKSEAIWALNDLGRLEEDRRKRQGTSPGKDDLLPPFPIGVVATRSSDKPESTARVIVFSSEQFPTDDVAQTLGAEQTAQGIKVYALYPGNTDLFLNSIHYLSNPDRISISPRRSDVPRLDKLEEGAVAQFWRIFLVGIWPAVALLAGGAAWLARRR